MDREAWHATVHGVAKSCTWLSDWSDSIGLYFCYQSHPYLGVVFALASSYHSFWSYFSTCVHIGHLPTWGVPPSVSYLFAFSCCSWGSQGKNPEVVCHSFLQSILKEIQPWVWVSSRSWLWTGRPGVLWSMGSQRVGHDWATELNCIRAFCWIFLSDILSKALCRIIARDIRTETLMIHSRFTKGNAENCPCLGSCGEPLIFLQ